ncbi:Two component system response regulator/histidine kinase [Desulfonema limicola]|uniref:histidine kinase n=1 Tax=Desulfonema limicola TaxID=45656 RepID=A0A975BBZ8_9BACT|nr:response regulator [Desulfonema limicola]QTA82834.1 Two component system response regulator/histidine kinase [Desulfonema limicola]
MSKQQKYSVLIVDDMAINLQILTGFLKSDYRVRVSTSGKKALEIASSDNMPDLILLDVVMPEINGFDICRILKADEKTKEIPVIFITVLADIEDKVKGFAVGGADYVTKPFQQDEVTARVRTHLKIQHQKKLLQQQALELAEARNTAEKANKAKSIFLANMSHELRSPLNTILGFSQLMANARELPSEFRENAEIISRSGEHLLNLINDVLDMSKIEAGRVTLNEQIFDLHYLINDIVSMFRLKAEEKNLQLLAEWSDDVPRYVRSDEIKLRQILINLLSNAVKFTLKGRICLRVSMINNLFPDMVNLDSQNLFFEVEDTGPGISEEESGSLFKAFVQTKTGKGLQQGTGLGLPISKKFVQLMGGDIKVVSKAGINTIFSFYIKVKNADPSFYRPVSCTRITGLKPGQPEYRILVVDQDPDNRRLLKSFLKPIGFKIQESENGEKAVEIWKHWKPCLILMETSIQAAGCFDAARKIKSSQKLKNTVIIAMTTSSFEEKQAMETCDDFLGKPFYENEIFELIKKHINVKYIYQENIIDNSCTGNGSRIIDSETIDSLTLKKLPRHLLDPLKKAADETDPEEAERIISLIIEQDALSGRKLAKLVQNFRFDILQKIFEEI